MEAKEAISFLLDFAIQDISTRYIKPLSTFFFFESQQLLSFS